MTASPVAGGGVLAVLDECAAFMAQAHPQYDTADKLRAARSTVAELIAVQRKVIAWAASRCPCQDEKPDPCPLCNASVAAGTCKAVEAIFPAPLLAELRAALSNIEGAST